MEQEEEQTLEEAGEAECELKEEIKQVKMQQKQALKLYEQAI